MNIGFYACFDCFLSCRKDLYYEHFKEVDLKWESYRRSRKHGA